MGKVAVARLLIEAGASIERKTGKMSPPLHIAAQKGHVAVMELLLEAGADHKSTGAQNCTALHWCCQVKDGGGEGEGRDKGEITRGRGGMERASRLSRVAGGVALLDDWPGGGGFQLSEGGRFFFFFLSVFLSFFCVCVRIGEGGRFFFVCTVPAYFALDGLCFEVTCFCRAASIL